MDQPACTRTITPAEADHLADIVDQLPEGATLCLHAGRYPARLVLQRPIALRGTGSAPADVVLDGAGGGPVLQLWADGGEIAIANLTITGGSASPSANAGGVYAHGTARVLVEDVVFRGNGCDLAGGQALLTDAAPVVLSRCRVEGNIGERAAALQADQIGSITLRDTLVAGNEGRRAIMARGASHVSIERSTVVMTGRDTTAIDLGGSATQAPEVAIADSIVVGGRAIANGPVPGKARAARSVLDGSANGLEDSGQNRAQPMRFEREGSYVPAAGSAAIGLARNAAGLVDVAGRPRKAEGAAGAFEGP